MRQTGQTFRMLLQALIEGSNGKKVLIVAHSNDNARWCLDWALRIAHESAEPLGKHGLVFPNNGSVVFTGQHSCVARVPLGFDVTHYDHAIEELKG